MKTCKDCSLEKPLSDFYQARNGRPIARCKSCSSIYQKEWRKRNPERSDREKKRNIERAKLPKNKKVRNARRHGLSIQQYDEMLVKQAHRCAACKQVLSLDRRTQLDHDHSCCNKLPSCGKCVRGILCQRCNMILGLVKDDPVRLAALWIYLTDSGVADGTPLRYEPEEARKRALLMRVVSG